MPSAPICVCAVVLVLMFGCEIIAGTNTASVASRTHMMIRAKKSAAWPRCGMRCAIPWSCEGSAPQLFLQAFVRIGITRWCVACFFKLPDRSFFARFEQAIHLFDVAAGWNVDGEEAPVGALIRGSESRDGLPELLHVGVRDEETAGEIDA